MQSSLFPATGHSGENQLHLPEGQLAFYPDFLNQDEADHFYRELSEHTPWRQESLNFGGRSVPIPRLQAWYGDKKSRYGYSGLALDPLPWTSTLLELKTRVGEVSQAPFNSVLLNYYRDGKDSVAWHSDDEPELGDDPVIASLSLGVSRRFQFKHRRKKQHRAGFELHNGSLLVMGKGIQHNWYHQVPKQPEVEEGRINLTFRLILF